MNRRPSRDMSWTVVTQSPEFGDMPLLVLESHDPEFLEAMQEMKLGRLCIMEIVGNSPDVPAEFILYGKGQMHMPLLTGTWEESVGELVKVHRDAADWMLLFQGVTRDSKRVTIAWHQADSRCEKLPLREGWVVHLT